jgi:hypothetical protein
MLSVRREAIMITSENAVRPFVIATPTKCGTTTLEEMCRRHRGGRAQPGLPSFRIMDWEQPRRQHRMALPRNDALVARDANGKVLDWGDADRYLMVRNPYKRYMSMFEYLRAPHNYSKFGAREIQGREWRGRSRAGDWSDGPPMDFEQFLKFIAASRVLYGQGRWLKRRGYIADPFAYRSPWVWLDSLTDSQRYLMVQPGDSVVRLLHLEQFWDEMAMLKHTYELKSLSVRPTIRANKTLTYMGNAADYWGGIKHGRRAFDGLGRYKGPVLSVDGCACGACMVRVGDEAAALGYMG